MLGAEVPTEAAASPGSLGASRAHRSPGGHSDLHPLSRRLYLVENPDGDREPGLQSWGFKAAIVDIDQPDEALAYANRAVYCYSCIYHP